MRSKKHLLLLLALSPLFLPSTTQAQVSRNSSYTVQENSEQNRLHLDFSFDFSAHFFFAFHVVELPSHGTIYVRNGDTFDPLSAGQEVGTNVWAYTPAPGFTGKDSFKWKLWVDGLGTSPVATVTINVVANTPPEARDQGVIVVAGEQRELPLMVMDADETREAIGVEITKQPLHGTLKVEPPAATGLPKVTYTPSPGFTGQDLFNWRASDGSTTTQEATCRILVRAADRRQGTTILVVVEERLRPELESDLQRLVADMQREGYTSKLLAFNGTKASALWSLLRDEYSRDGQFVAGAVLIGRLPLARAVASSPYDKTYTTDLYYWNLRHEGRTAPSQGQIWVSRIHGSPTEREVQTIRWALQANHDMRTGAHRLPHTALRFSVPEFDTDYARNAEATGSLEVWPSELFLEMGEAWARGGDLLKSVMHGGQLRTRFIGHTGHPIQTRYNCPSSCSLGGLGNVSNQLILSRGGGAVFSVGATTTTYTGAFNVIWDVTEPDKSFRARLVQGDSWGAALRDHYAFDDHKRAIFYGDMSMPVMAAPANLAPQVDSLSADKETGLPPLDVSFTASASDSDGTLTRYEWYCEGFGAGTTPALATTGTAASCRYDLPHRYPAEVQVVDNYKARGWKKQTIVVQPDPDTPMRINAGRVGVSQAEYLRGADLVDSQGYLWLHEERYAVDGGWGLEANKAVEGVVRATVPIEQTDDKELFRTYRGVRGDGYARYRLPLGKGRFTVWIGFLEPDANVTTGQRLVDVSVGTESWLQGFDVLNATGGAGRAHFLSKVFEVQGEELVIEFRRNINSERDAVFSALAVFPGDHATSSPPDAGMRPRDAGVSADQAAPPPPPPTPDSGVDSGEDEFLADSGPAPDLGGALVPDPPPAPDARVPADEMDAPAPDMGVADDAGSLPVPAPAADARVMGFAPGQTSEAPSGRLRGGCSVDETRNAGWLPLLLLALLLWGVRRERKERRRAARGR